MIDLSRLKLGATPPVPDIRNIMLKEIIKLKQLPPLPETYDVDVSLSKIIPDAMDGNDKYGDCVKAAQAKQLRRFECFEQGDNLDITEKVIVDAYFAETGGPDSGLDVLTSLKKWRREGWNIGENNYRIYAFAAVDWLDHIEVEYAIYLFQGLQITLALPVSAQSEAVWTALIDTPGSWGYHQVYSPRYADIVGYNANGVICRTWGGEKLMTWEWWDKYVCGVFVIIDDKDYWLLDSPVDIGKLSELLLAANHTLPEPEPNPLPYPGPYPPPSPSPCKWGKTIAAGMNLVFLQKIRGRKGRFMYLNP